MAKKKKIPAMAIPKARAMRRWHVVLMEGYTEVEAHECSGYSGVLEFSVWTDNDYIIVRVFAPGIWKSCELGATLTDEQQP